MSRLQCGRKTVDHREPVVRVIRPSSIHVVFRKVREKHRRRYIGLGRIAVLVPYFFCGIYLPSFLWVLFYRRVEIVIFASFAYWTWRDVLVYLLLCLFCCLCGGVVVEGIIIIIMIIMIITVVVIPCAVRRSPTHVMSLFWAERGGLAWLRQIPFVIVSALCSLTQSFRGPVW